MPVKRLPPILLALTLALLSASCTSPVREQARAQKLDQQGKVKEALRLYMDAMLRLPRTDNRQISQLYVRIGECLWRLGRANEAFTAFQQAMEVDASNLLAHIKVGTMYLAGGAPANAREQANYVLRHTDANSDAWALLGAASAANGEDGMAKWAYTRVLAAEPGRVSVAVAEVYDREGEMDLAQNILRNAAKAQPSSAMPVLALARLQEEQGNSAGA